MALGWAWLLMTAKGAQAQGWLLFHTQRLAQRRTTLIEYKR
jgi:hypothetical protein